MQRACRPSGARAGSIASQRDVVERAEAYVRARPDTSVPVSQLCQLVGVSERCLRNAFYGVHGMGPKRWMITERLQRVRLALKQASMGEATVTAVATGYGFYELGRFAASYKQAFREAPSETLRGTSRTTTANLRRQADVPTGRPNHSDRSFESPMPGRAGARAI